MKPLVWFLAVFLVVLLTGCGSNIDNPTISENDDQAQLAPPVYTETQINSLILAEAARQVGTPNAISGSCKVWVQNLVSKATGRWIPQNDPWALYQWKPSGVTRVVWQVKFACIGSFPNYLKPGQIMQIQWRPTYMNGCEHTIILSSISPNSISYYEANAPVGGPVRYATTKLVNWKAAAWTVYQVR